MLRFSNALLSFLIIAASLLRGTIHARNIRDNNRVQAQIERVDNADEGEVATVSEIYPTPYPPADYRPGRAFNLPNEGSESAEHTEDSELETDLYITTTADILDVKNTTPYNWASADFSRQNDANLGPAVKAPYPPSGWRPKQPFLLPNESYDDSEVLDAFSTSTATPLAPFTTRLPDIDESTELAEVEFDVATKVTQASIAEHSKAPYPPSGWRPSRAFLLPVEVESANQKSTIVVNEPEPPLSPADKAGHPACGVSDNPMSPKPAEDAKENPDAERVYVTTNLDPPVVGAPLTLPVLSRSQQLITPPIYVPFGRSLSYTASVQSWR